MPRTVAPRNIRSLMDINKCFDLGSGTRAPCVYASLSIAADHQRRCGCLHGIGDVAVDEAGDVLTAEEVVVGGGAATWRVTAKCLAGGAGGGRTHPELRAHDGDALVNIESG